MIEGNVESVRAIAKLAKEIGNGLSASVSVGYYERGLDHTQLFLPRAEMACIAEELGVELKIKPHSDNGVDEWVYFVFDGVEFGSLLLKESVENVIKEEQNNG